MNLQINLNYLYFSATGYTKMIIREIGKSLLREYSATIENEKKLVINIKNSITNNKEDRYKLSNNDNRSQSNIKYNTLLKAQDNYLFNREILEYDFTLPINRTNKLTFTSNDLVIVGVPVYAGRVPNLLLPFINSIEGNGAKAIAVVTFGNRAFDDALSEISHILVKSNFTLLGGGAFVAEHAFSHKIANGRPNETDFTQIREFAVQILNNYINVLKIDSSAKISTDITKHFSINIPGNAPEKMHYYKPIGESGSIDIRKVKPQTTLVCNSCGACVAVCPMGSIDISNPKEVLGVCIKCGACVKQCPIGAKYFNDKDYEYHVEWLIRECGYREAKNFIFY